jgi:hypothetical protein
MVAAADSPLEHAASAPTPPSSAAAGGALDHAARRPLGEHLLKHLRGHRLSRS